MAYKALGWEKLAVSDTAVGLSEIPTVGLKGATIQADFEVRVLTTGDTPTSSDGYLIQPGLDYEVDADDLPLLKVIRATGNDAVVQIFYYGVN